MQIWAVTALAFGLYISLFNWSTVFWSRPEKHVSPIPLLGAGLVATGLLAFESTRGYWWLALFIDFGTLGLALVLPSLASQAWLHSNRNVAYKFVDATDDRTVIIALFKNGDAQIDIAFDPPKPHGDRGDRACSVGYGGKWTEADNGFQLSDYAGGRQMAINQSGDQYRVTETCPDGDDPSIYSLDEIVVSQQIGRHSNT